MLFDLRRDADALGKPCDVCIVGAGVAGQALARRLAGKGHEVILLESGGLERLLAQAGMTDLYLIVRAEQAPNPDSRILLSSERDALGNRRADLSWQLSTLDKHSAHVLAETFDAELRRLGKDRVVYSDWLTEPGTQWPYDPTVGNHPIGGYHHLGGTRMSDDPAHGVVDADSRVH